MFGYFVVRQRWRREEEETRQMYSFVEKIIGEVKDSHLVSLVSVLLFFRLQLLALNAWSFPFDERVETFTGSSYPLKGFLFRES